MTTQTPLEVKKDGLSQLQDGSWVLKLKVHPSDMIVSLMQAPMGTRYAVALVEIGDDEQPVAHGAQNSGASRTNPERRAEKGAVAHRSWEDLSHAQQAGILCSQAEFQTFCGISPTADRADALTANVVRDKCGVASRSDLDADPDKGILWRNLVADFRNWQRGVEP